MDRQITTYYYHVYRDIVTQIYLGTYKRGEALPSMRELCSIYQVGRNTVRTALMLLEEHGYIEIEPRKQAVVTFSLDNPKYREYYLTELASQKKAVGEVYDFMELFMPELFAFILERLPRSIRMELACTAGFYGENLQDTSVRSEQGLGRHVMQLYRLILVMGNNHLVEQLFQSLYYSIQLPVQDKEFNMVTYRAVCVMIKTTLKKCQRYIEAGEYGKLKKQVAVLCQTQKKRTCSYLNKICKGFKAEDKPYCWSVRGAQETEYIQMASNIMVKIAEGTYGNGMLIPSYAQLAEEGGVSEQVSRSAIELLNRLKVVVTINGVGTKVEGVTKEGAELLLNDIDLHPLVISLLEAQQILVMICEGVLKSAADHMTTEQFLEAEEAVCGRDYREVFRVFMRYVKVPVAREVYRGLAREMAWGTLLDAAISRDGDYSVVIPQNRPDMKTADKVIWLTRQTRKCCMDYFNEVRKLAELYRIKVKLLPVDLKEL